MRTSHNNPDTLLLIMMKLSILFLLCLAIVNAPHLKGQAIHLPIQEPLILVRQQKVQQIYTAQIGIREKGTNSGGDVEQYLRYVNLPKGNPWCAAFVCWVFGQAGLENPRTGWSPSLFPTSKVIWSRESGTKSQESGHPPGVLESGHSNLARQETGNRQPDSYRVITPASGDVFGIYFPEKNRIAHVGFIDRWDGTWLISVEGNTNLSGNTAEDGVYRKRRLIRTVYQVARYIND